MSQTVHSFLGRLFPFLVYEPHFENGPMEGAPSWQDWIYRNKRELILPSYIHLYLKIFAPWRHLVVSKHSKINFVEFNLSLTFD